MKTSLVAFSALAAVCALSARAYIWESDQWTYQTTQKVNISGDNWKAGLGCPNKGPFAITFE